MRMSKLASATNIRSLGCFFGLCLAVLMNAGIAHAQMDAYSVQVAVIDRSEKEQQNAYLVAMRSVLLANSGDKTLLNRDDVRAGLRQADTYVESFRYDAPAPGTVISRDTPLTDAVRSSGQATQLMLVQFNRQLINELIRPSTANTVETDEPDVQFDPFANVSSSLMWLIVEDGGRQMLISAANGQNVMERAREIAGGSGLSLSFPAGDQNDVQAVTIEDIKTGSVESISAAASRYAQPLTLAAHLIRTRTGTWEGVWVKIAAGQQQNQAFTSRSLDAGLQQGIAWLNSTPTSVQPAQNDFQTNLSANTSSAEGLLWVSPLRTTQDYARMMDFLTSLDGVSVAFPKEVLSGGVVFAILPRSAVPLVASAASTRNWLRQSPTPSSAAQSRFAGSISASFEYLR